MSLSIKLGLAAGLLMGSGPVAAEEDDWPAAEVLDRLAAGEVTAESVRTDESGGAARFQVYMRSSAESIWSVLFSCEQGFVFVKGLRECEVLENDGTETLTRQVVKTSWLVPAQDFTFRTYRESGFRAEFVRTEGSPREMEGSWEFLPWEDGLIVTHEIRIRSGFPVPRFLIRTVMKKNMPDMLRCVRALSNGSLNQAQQATDAASCPGSSD